MKLKLLFLLLTLSPIVLLGQIEICDNGIDDDNDNLIDLNDDDCTCEIIEPVSMIPNSSFEELDCCPNSNSQLDCASHWVQASAPTTDFIHQCGWQGWGEYPVPQPFPDGIGIVGFRDGWVLGDGVAEPYWKEYAGACLTSPLLKDSTYRFQFDVGFVDPEISPPIYVSFFGTASCENFPFGNGDDTFGCPSNSPQWTKLGTVYVSGGSGGTWVRSFIEIVPNEDIYAIAIGPDCDPVSSSVSIYYFFDNLLLSERKLFDYQIKEVYHPCSSDFLLSVNDNPKLKYQWYMSGTALEGEVFAKLSQNYGEGSYQVRIMDGTSCFLSTEYSYEIPSFTFPEKAAICQGEFYNFGDLQLSEPGIYLDTLKNQSDCDSIVLLELEVVGTKYDTIEVSKFEGEVFQLGEYRFEQEGEYPLMFVSSIGCDSLILLKLSNFEIHIPNVFSPNFDGANDVFYPFAADGVIKSVNMKIYDRWGNLIYQGSEWDGSDMKSDVFVYFIKIEFMQGDDKVFYGSVTVLK